MIMSPLTCLLLIVLMASVSCEGIANGKVHCYAGQVKCDPGYVYSKDDPSVYCGHPLGHCRPHLWASQEGEDCISLEEGFPVPRVPGAGWSVCITAIPTKYTRIGVDLNAAGRHIVVSHFDIRMSNEFGESIVVNEKDDSMNYPWRHEDIYHPRPYPFAVGDLFTLKITAQDEHTVVYHVNGHQVATRSVTHPVSIVKDVSITGDVDVKKIDTWCS